jgi:hypothetical protein
MDNSLTGEKIITPDAPSVQTIQSRNSRKSLFNKRLQCLQIAYKNPQLLMYLAELQQLVLQTGLRCFKGLSVSRSRSHQNRHDIPTCRRHSRASKQHTRRGFQSIVTQETRFAQTSGFRFLRKLLRRNPEDSAPSPEWLPRKFFRRRSVPLQTCRQSTTHVPDRGRQLLRSTSLTAAKLPSEPKDAILSPRLARKA